MKMRLTIITINYNNAAGLQKTMESVLVQTSHDFEYIVVDGASTDASCQVISQKLTVNGNQLSVNSDKLLEMGEGKVNGISVRWISEPDNGIYHAMNKGIGMAKGEYLHFLNSGDWLVDATVVENMLATLHTHCDILVGNVIQVRSDGKKRLCTNSQPMSLLTFYNGTIQHTSAYIRADLYVKYGLYDETLKIVSDWKWYLQVVGLSGTLVQFTDIQVSCFDMSGISSTNLQLDKAERRQVLEELLPAPVLADYDSYHLAIEQYTRLRRYPAIYNFFYVVERVLFKFDKWKLGYWNWKK
jgi:Glycosyltransferases involved in cell wall biogenesis